MVLIKGELFRRYPNTNVYAIEALASGMPHLPDDTYESIKPTFHAVLPPDMVFFGFDYDAQQLRNDGQWGTGFFIVLEECVGEIRFGADKADAKDGSSTGTLSDWNQVPMSAAASRHFPLLMVGEFGLGGIPTAIGRPHPAKRGTDI